MRFCENYEKLLCILQFNGIKNCRNRENVISDLVGKITSSYDNFVVNSDPHYMGEFEKIFKVMNVLNLEICSGVEHLDPENYLGHTNGYIIPHNGHDAIWNIRRVRTQIRRLKIRMYLANINEIPPNTHEFFAQSLSRTINNLYIPQWGASLYDTPHRILRINTRIIHCRFPVKGKTFFIFPCKIRSFTLQIKYSNLVKIYRVIRKVFFF